MTLRKEGERWLCRKSKKAVREEDVSAIIEFIAPDVCAIMGRAGRTDFHTYLCKEGNRWLQMYGVTSLLSYWGEKDKLVQWAVDRGIEHIRAKGEEAVPGLWYITEDCLEASRTAHKRSLNEASTLGTAVHAEVEAYVKKCIEHGGRMPGAIPEGSEEAQAFMKWAEENNVEFLASEKVVYSKRLWTAGTMDFLCRINGKLFVGDVKTSNWISPKHFLQCGAYSTFWEEQREKEVSAECEGLDFVETVDYVNSKKLAIEGIVIVQLPRTGGIKVVTNEQVGVSVDNLKSGFEKVVSLVKLDKDISSNLYI